jgi:hypothetical protein
VAEEIGDSVIKRKQKWVSEVLLLVDLHGEESKGQNAHQQWRSKGDLTWLYYSLTTGKSGNCGHSRLEESKG